MTLLHTFITLSYNASATSSVVLHPPVKPLEHVMEPTTFPRLTFDEPGDLLLKVGPQKQEMVVDSRALCRASPPFRKMLTGRFAEAKPESGEWIVTLPDDDCHGFAILMDLVHALYRYTPPWAKIEELFSIAVLTDKYDMTRILRPMVWKWLLPDELPRGPYTAREQMMLSFVAWELGLEMLFGQMMDLLAVSCQANQARKLLDEDGKLLMEYPEYVHFNRLDVESIIVSTRRMKVNIILEECKELGAVIFSDGGSRRYKAHSLHHTPWENDPGNSPSHQICHTHAVCNFSQLAYKLGIMELFLGRRPAVSQSVAHLRRTISRLSAAFQALCDPIPRLEIEIERQFRRTTFPTELLVHPKRHILTQAEKTSYWAYRTSW